MPPPAPPQRPVEREPGSRTPAAGTPSAPGDAGTTPRNEGRFRRACRAGGVVLLGALLVGTALAATASSFWLGELVANLRWQMGLSGLAGAALLLVGRRRAGAALAAVLAAVHLAPALALSLPVERPVPDGRAPSFDVATANLDIFNDDDAALESWLRAERPDVVAFEEVDAFWRAELERLRELYPHQVHSPLMHCDDRDDFGVSLLSRLPVERGDVHWGPRGLRPYLDCSVRLAERSIQVVVLHPMRPGMPPLTAMRDELLEDVARTVRWSDDAVILGDLNATLYSPAFRSFVDRAELHDSRAGFGRNATYRSDHWVSGLWLDLDHILLRPGLLATARGVGPAIGSDHRPATATLALAAPGAERTASAATAARASRASSE